MRRVCLTDRQSPIQIPPDICIVRSASIGAIAVLSASSRLRSTSFSYVWRKIEDNLGQEPASISGESVLANGTEVPEDDETLSGQNR